MKDTSRKLHTISIVLVTILLTILIGILDIVTTSQYRLFFFYIIPIIIASFHLKIWYSIFLSCVSTLFIVVSVYIDHHALYLNHFWNAGMMLIIFLSISYFARLLNRIRFIEKEKAFIEEKNSILNISLEEKEMLIRETNHRMKNNLAMLSSLIGLSGGTDSKKLIVNLNNRIQTFSILYEKLSYSKNNEMRIMLNGYLGEIVDLIFKTSEIPRAQLTYAITGDDLHVSLKSATLLGLIINELATNSIQHAFKEMPDMPNSINIKILKGDRVITMVYCDNGPGFNCQDVAAKEGHIGFLLMNSISKQLGSEVRYTGGKCSEFTFIFSDLLLINDGK